MSARMRGVGKLTSRMSGCTSAGIRLSGTIEQRQRRGCGYTESCRFCQVSVNEGDGHRALAYCGGDALDRAVAHIPGGEGARNRGLQVVGCALQRPGGRSLAIDQEVGASDKVAALIADDGGVCGPISVGHAA